MATSLRFTPIVVLILVTLGAGHVQAAAVCSNTPGAGDSIECTEDATSTDDIDIDVADIDIDTTADEDPGVHAKHEGTGNIDIEVRSSTLSTRSTIDTSGTFSYGFNAEHTGTGDITIDVQNTDVTTTGAYAHGFYSKHTGDGDIDIDLDDVMIDAQATVESTHNGINAAHHGDGDIDIQVKDTTSNGEFIIEHFGVGTSTMRVENTTIELSDERISSGVNNSSLYFAGDPTKNGPTHSRTYVTDSSITVRADYLAGIEGVVSDISTEGEVLIEVDNSIITTTGESSFGINALNQATVGDVRVTVRNSEVHSTDNGILAKRDGTETGTGRGAVHVDVRNSDIFTTVPVTSGIRVRNESADATADDVQRTFVQDSTITTSGYVGHGIYSSRTGDGDNVIETQNTDIVTEATEFHPRLPGSYSYGIYAVHHALGNIDIDFQGGSVETYGANSHGIVAYHYGTAEENRISIDIGGRIDVRGDSAQGVRVGTLASGAPARVAPIGMDGYRRQTVTVNGPVTSNGEGVFLAGGGRVVIGSRGSIDSESGIAILATGEVPEDVSDPNNVIPAIQPKLWVDLNLDGRQVAEAIGNNWIINDGGETTIAVNNIVLHEGDAGVTGRTAPNGAWNVTMREHGVKVDDSTADRVDWTFTQSTDGDKITADRDFSTQDFTETARPRPRPRPTPEPEPEPEPEPLPEPLPEPEPEPEPETGMPMFMEEYAPRAAVYEVLPDFMLRMQNWAPTSPRLFLPESPVYIRLLGNTGSQEFKHSTVNTNYDADRFAVEAGVKIPLFENLDIWASMHHVTGSAEVDSPVNGGDIDVTGVGLSLDAYWSGEDDYYAAGRLSLTDYDIDLSSNTIGRLKSNGDANGRSLHVEAGRRMTLNEHLHWTPRAWLGHTRISVDQFTDAVDSRVSFPNTDRFTGGLGVMAETVRTEYGGGELLLRGSLDFEQKLGDSKTVTLVSGEKLSAEPEKSSAYLSLGGAWHKGSFTYSAELSARQELNSGGKDYSGVIHVGMRF